MSDLYYYFWSLISPNCVNLTLKIILNIKNCFPTLKERKEFLHTIENGEIMCS